MSDDSTEIQSEVVVPVEPAVKPTAPANLEHKPVVVEPVPEATESFPDYEHPGLNLTAKWLSGLGLSPQHEIIQLAQETGDWSYLEAHLASLGDKARGWEQYVALAKKGFEEIESKQEASEKETKDAVLSVFGGDEEQWGEVQAWASANADDAEKEQINAAFAKGGLLAKMAANYLKTSYEGQQEVKAPTSPSFSQEPATRRASHTALSPQEYKSAVAALASRVGAHRVSDHPEYQQLKQRRQAFQG